MKKVILLSLVFIYVLISLDIKAQDDHWKRIIDKPTFDVSVNPRNPNTYYTGGEGRVVYRSWDKGNNWDTLIINYKQGFTRFNNVLIHPIDTNIIIIGGLNFGVIERCTTDCDEPDNWEVVLSSTNPVALNGKSMMFKPDQPDTIYAGDFMYGICWRSTDKGATWDSISTVTRKYTFKKPDGTPYDTVLPVRLGSTAIREDSTNILVFGSTSAEICISTDGGYTWDYKQTLIEPDSAQDDCEITRIVFSDRDPLVGYACITYLFLLNRNNGGTYKTTDGGYNWFQVAHPDTSIWALSSRGYGNTDEVWIGGYTEDFYMVDSMRVPGAGIVRRSQDGGQTWENYDHQMDWALRFHKSNSNLRSIYFSTHDSGFAVGNYGVIMRSQDAGTEWNTIYNPGYQSFTGAVFRDSKTGLLVASSGEIMKTVNGGVLLTESFKDPEKHFYSIAQLDENNYVTCGSSGLIMETTDMGESNWIEKESGVNDDLMTVFFVDNQNGWAGGMDGVIIKTSDGGDTWTEQSSGTSQTINSICFKDASVGLAVGSEGLILRTDDGGENWTELSALTESELFSVSFNKFGTDKNIALITGDNAEAYKTTDAGLNWISLETNNVRPFYSCQTLSDLFYVSSGQYGTIIQSQSGGEWWFVNQRGDGPVSNSWSLRYLGEPGNEDLYLATEAGLFVIREPSSPLDIYEQYQEFNDSENLMLIHYSNNTIKLNYELINKSTTNNLIFRICDIKGQTHYINQFMPDDSIIEKYIYDIELPPGAYLCQMIEYDKSTVKLIIVE